MISKSDSELLPQKNMVWIRKILFLIFVFLLVSRGFAQTVKYTRKSISYVDVLLVTKREIHLPDRNERYFLSAIRDGIKIARFDYNPLPEKVQSSFKNSYSMGGSYSESEIGDLIDETIASELIKILDVQKEIRAKNLVTEVQKNSFIVLKAKEMGITAEQLEQVMNSSYLYVPFLSKYKVEKGKDKKDEDKKEISVSIKGGLIWYHLIAGDNPGVEKIEKIVARGEASDENHNSAFRSAAQTLAMNLQVRTREIDMFKLQSPIAEVVKRTIRFPLGKAEGIKMDEPFFVGEWVESNDGKIRFEKSGFVRVGTVTDNRTSAGQLSSAWAVKKGDWVRGMMIIEHPRLGIDIAVKPRWFTMNIEEGVFLNTDKKFLVYFDDYKGGAIGIDMDIQWNIAQFTKKRQTFFILGGSAGAVPVNSRIYDSGFDLFFDTPTINRVAGVFHGYVGFMKKVYLGPFALHGEGLAGIQVLSIYDFHSNDYYEGEDVTISNNSLGLRFNLGLEYAVNIDCNVGVFAGFNLFPPMDWWTLKYDEDEVDMDNLADWAAPKIYSFGPTYGFYIHFSPPTLPFNPVAIAQSKLKVF